MGLEKCPYLFVLRLVPVWVGTLLCVIASGTVFQGWCYGIVNLAQFSSNDIHIEYGIPGCGVFKGGIQN